MSESLVVGVDMLRLWLSQFPLQCQPNPLESSSSVGTLIPGLDVIRSSICQCLSPRRKALLISIMGDIQPSQ